MTTPQQLSRLCSVYGVILILPLVVCQDCQPECHAGHGICINGGCFCHSPWGGEDCASDVSGSEDSLQPVRPQALTSDELDEEQAPQATVEDRLAPVSAAPETSLLDSGSQEILTASPLSLPGVLLRRPVVPSASTEETATLPSQAINMPSPLQGTASMENSSPSAIPTQPVPTNSRLNVAVQNSIESIPSRAHEQDPLALVDDTQTRSSGNLRKAKRRIDTLSARHAKTTYKLVSSVGDKDDERSRKIVNYLAKNASSIRGSNSLRTNDTKTHEIMLMKSLSAGIVSTESCYYLPFIIQGIILVSTILFLALGCCFDNGLDGVVEESWCCMCCIWFSRCLVGLRWQTQLIALVLIVSCDAGWIYLCNAGTAVKYIEQALFISYIAFIALGIGFLVLLECWFSVGRKRYRQFKELSERVTHLVDLLDVQYGPQLKEMKANMKKHGHNVADKLDDVTDFVGLTECSSDDDITCMQAVQCKGPTPKKKPQARETGMAGRVRQSLKLSGTS